MSKRTIERQTLGTLLCRRTAANRAPLLQLRYQSGAIAGHTLDTNGHNTLFLVPVMRAKRKQSRVYIPLHFISLYAVVYVSICGWRFYLDAHQYMFHFCCFQLHLRKIHGYCSFPKKLPLNNGTKSRMVCCLSTNCDARLTWKHSFDFVILHHWEQAIGMLAHHWKKKRHGQSLLRGYLHMVLCVFLFAILATMIAAVCVQLLFKECS